MPRSIFSFVTFTIVVSVLFSCRPDAPDHGKNKATEPVRVFHTGDSVLLKQFESLDLDNTYPNLLENNSDTVNTEEVFNSWMKLHQAMGTQLDNNGFNWYSRDSIIQILHKVYFEPDGHISHYFFNIINSEVPDSVVTAFAVQVDTFARRARIELDFSGKFAQCGKTSYINQSPM